MKIIIKNGYVYDPINGINGEKMDIFVENGKIVEKIDEKDARIIDATNKVVMPGGVDIHSHIAGPKVNVGRILRPEDHRKDPVRKTRTARAGVGYSIPSVFTTGYRYAIMGYTTVIEPASAPLKNKHTHEELTDIPMIDKAVFLLLDNNYFTLTFVKNKELDKLKLFVAWILKATKSYAVKIVNPGGVENWKWGKNVNSIDDKVLGGYDVTPREIVTSLARVNEELGLPHTIHVHCNNLGSPGNYEVTLQTMECVKNIPSRRDRRIHITHIQFNAYKGKDWTDFASGGAEIADYLNKNNHVTVDLGQVIFTDTTTMTADGPWQYKLYKLTGNKWAGSDIEMEVSGGIVPYVFKRKSPVNAIQWCVGLEVMLLTKDPWRVFLTTDHPNGGPFIYYPKVIAWLVSKKARKETMERIHRLAKERTSLEGIEREFDLYEIAIVTRAGTAKALGLKNKGHLGVGADADIAIYDIDPNKISSERYEEIEKAFSRALYTIKGGEIVVKDGEIVKEVYGKTMWVDVKIDESEEKEFLEEIKPTFEKYYTIRLSNYVVPDVYVPLQERIVVGG